MDYSTIAQKLIENLGGQSNIRTVTHCMTRLRFILNDESVVDDKIVENIPGVMGIMKRADNTRSSSAITSPNAIRKLQN